MKKEPLISIIIPTLNSEATLQRCLNSIIEQTYLNYEILIVDGASKDKTLEIAYGYNNPRIKIHSEPDKGIYDAMNKGIKLSKGEWIYFLGSDDTLYDSMILEYVYTYSMNRRLDVIYGNVFIPNSNSIYDGKFSFEKIQTKNICHQAIFYKKRVLEYFGGFDLKYKSHADHNLNLKWFFSSRYKNLYIDKIIAIYSNMGFSLTYNDNKFFEDLPAKLIQLGLTKLNIIKLKEYARVAASNEHNKKRYVRFLFFRCLIFFFRIVDIIQRIILRIK